MYTKLFLSIRLPLFAIVMVLVSSCSDFGTINVNPNAAEVPVTSALLTNTLIGIPSTSSTGALTMGLAGRGTAGSVEPMLFVQYWSQSQYPESSLYSTTTASWDNYYAISLEDLQKIIDFNTNEATKATVAQYGSNNNQLAVARILKAYFFWVVTDRWGDIPYSEALKENTVPKYDSQADIYTDILKELTESVAQFDNGTAFSGDILYNGNTAKWKKFANSLRMLVALRMSKVAPEKAKTEFLAAYNNAAGHISTNTDNAVITYLDANNFRNPWNALFDGRDDYGVSNILVDKLKSLNDPRLSAYAAPNADGEYIGLPYGLQRDVLLDWTGKNDHSRPSSKVLAKTFPGYVVTATQMLFAKSEAALNGWISEDASTLYTNAVKASFEQWGITSSADTYLAKAEVAFNGTTQEKLAKIGTQRWIGLYPNGQEAWFEWRRTGYPDLKPTPYAVNETKQIPRRYAYPSNEAQLNKAAYETATSGITGGDKHSSRVWWDK